MSIYYPEGLSASDLCHMEGHDYGRYDEKCVSTCQRCYAQNLNLRSYIGAVTRKARQWNCSWVEAEKCWTEELEAQAQDRSRSST